MSVQQTIHQRLTEAFRPAYLEVIDESSKHKGHAGWREEGETHFKVVMRAAAFAGASRVDRQRMVHKELADLLAERVHALSLEITAPDGG